MIESVLIQPALIADAQAIVALDRTIPEGGWEANAIADLVQDSAVICRVARSYSGIAGFALCRLAADECEVLSCAVGADFRRMGTARLLLQAAFDAAVRRGGRRVFLEVAEDNAPARGLYSDLGFEIVGRRPRYYRRSGGEMVDALIMNRAL
jgi:[ribosomal protein S18]-alanine N-acetyltransferase